MDGHEAVERLDDEYRRIKAAHPTPHRHERAVETSWGGWRCSCGEQMPDNTRPPANLASLWPGGIPQAVQDTEVGQCGMPGCTVSHSGPGYDGGRVPAGDSFEARRERRMAMTGHRERLINTRAPQAWPGDRWPGY